MPLTASRSTHSPAVIALQSITYIASHEDVLARFLGLSGLAPDQLRTSLHDPMFHGAVLDFLLQDEALLLAFCANTTIDPAAVVRARRSLPGTSE